MSNLSNVREKPIPLGFKISLCAWMGAVMFVFVVMYGPAEFWYLMARLGVSGHLGLIQAWLQKFFTAGYHS